MVLDKLSKFATDHLKKKCPYFKNCGGEGIKACYENYGTCTIYQRKEIVNQRIVAMGIRPISRIEKIVE